MRTARPAGVEKTPEPRSGVPKVRTEKQYGLPEGRSRSRRGSQKRDTPFPRRILTIRAGHASRSRRLGGRDRKRSRAPLFIIVYPHSDHRKDPTVKNGVEKCPAVSGQRPVSSHVLGQFRTKLS